MIDCLQYVIASRSIFEIQLKTDPSLLTDIQRAVRWYSLQSSGFGGQGRSFGVSKGRAPRLSRKRAERDIEAAHERIANAQIENIDGLECIRRYDGSDVLFYIDPPYYGCENDYAVKWPRARFTELAELLNGIQGRFILSLNDRKEVRDIFGHLNIKSVSVQYSAGKSAASRSPARGEVLISNFKLKKG